MNQTPGLLDVHHSAVQDTDAFPTAQVLLWIQTPWRFLQGKYFQLRSKGSLNMLIFHESCLILCFSCKDTVMDRCGDGSHSLQKAQI